MPNNNHDSLKCLRIISKKELLTLVPYTAVQILRMERDGRFPRRVQLGPNRVGWVYEEVEAWIKARMAEREPCDDVEIISEEPDSLPEPDAAGGNGGDKGHFVMAGSGDGDDDDDDSDDQDPEAFVTVEAMSEAIARSPSELARMVELGKMPPIRALNDGRSGWFQHELAAYANGQHH